MVIIQVVAMSLALLQRTARGRSDAHDAHDRRGDDVGRRYRRTAGRGGED
jgi:hypothetical protein